MIPKIRKLNPAMVWWDGYKWVTNRWMVGTKGNGFDCVPTFGRAIRFWLWHCGVPPKIAFGWFKRKDKYIPPFLVKTKKDYGMERN